ncbi:MAG: response regulator [Alphaproteobacteria bacterium]|nr:response regulator [Alphaproteobacteria bacterium]
MKQSMLFASFYDELKNLLSIDFFMLLSICSVSTVIILLFVFLKCNRIRKKLEIDVDVLHAISISLSNNNEIVAFNGDDLVLYATYPNLYSNKEEFIDVLNRDIAITTFYKAFCKALKQNDNCQLLLTSKDSKKYKKRFIASVHVQNDVTVATLTDITKYYAQTDEIIRNHRKLEAYIDNLPVGIFYIDNNGKILGCNTTFASYLQTSKDKIIGVSLHDFIDDLDLIQLNDKPLHITIKTKYSPNIKAFLIKPSALSFHTSQPLIVIKTHEDEVQVNQKIVKTEKPNTQEKKVQPIQKDIITQKIFDDSNIASMITDTDGVIVHTNKAFTNLIGNSKILSIKHNIIDFLHNSKEDLNTIIESTNNYLELPLKCYNDEEQELNKTVQLYVSHFNDSTNNKKVLLQFIDITEQKTMDQQFLQSQKIQAIGQLASGIAHDFNNLLTAMIGFCDLLLQRYNQDDPPYGDIQQIKHNANRAANLVKQLLAFSRQQALNPQVISIKNTLLDMSSLLKRLLGPNVNLSFNYSSTNIWNVKVDNIQFEQVIMNLVVNARDAMHNKGNLTIQVRNYYAEKSFRCFDDTVQVGDYVLLEVIDTGCGMDQETAKHIFEPFFTRKIKDIKDGTSSGTGLGLATVYGIVKQTGGYINVKSELNKGTNFQIFIPRYNGNDEVMQNNNDTNTDKNKSEYNSDLSGYETILLVEDEDPVRNFISRALKDKGYNVIEARSGSDALQIANDTNMDLLITDVIMPKMDGPTLNKKLREIKSGFKTIFISGYTEDTFRENLDKELGIYFMQKPFSLKDLVIKVKEVLSKKQ